MTTYLTTRTPELGILACPICHGGMDNDAAGLLCTRCKRVWPKSADHVDLSATLATDAGHDWQRRQAQMGGWYERLLDDPAEAIACFREDYEPLSAQLGSLSGRILDVGGGAGIARHYLRPEVEYVNVDPSTEWLALDWRGLQSSFPGLVRPMSFVQACGEQLPFASSSFDVTLALWSLNHSFAPACVVEECGRVLKRGGCLFVVLEDVEPRWLDLRLWHWRAALRLGRAKVTRRLRKRAWSTQSDHIPIREGELLAWTRKDFSLEHRGWTHGESPGYLSLRLRKR